MSQGRSLNRRQLNEKLFDAAAKCDVKTVAAALSEGADPNYVRGSRYTPLGMAISAGNVRTTELVEGRAVVAERDPVATVRLLLAAGADPDIADPDGMTPLMSAAIQPRVLTLLLPHSRKVNAATKGGQTPLMVAAAYGVTEAIRLLLAAGARVNLVRDNGRTALDEASHSPEAAELLRSDGALSGEMLAEGRAAAERKRKKDERAARRVDRIESKWPRPSFAKAADSQGFALARQRLRELCGGGGLIEIAHPPELVSYAVATRKRALDLVERHRDEFLKMGCFLFASGQALLATEQDRLSIVPTTDPYQVVSFMGTTRNNGAGPGDVCEGLKRIECERHFTLDRIVLNRLEGRWTGPLRDADRLARMLYRFCHDIVGQGVGTVAALAEALRRDDRLFLWWD